MSGVIVIDADLLRVGSVGTKVARRILAARREVVRLDRRDDAGPLRQAVVFYLGFEADRSGDPCATDRGRAPR